MKKKKFVCRNTFCRHSNTNIILSIIAVVWVWRGIWSLTDIAVFSSVEATLETVLGYGLPIIIGVLYLYFNDYSLDELAHGSPNE